MESGPNSSHMPHSLLVFVPFTAKRYFLQEAKNDNFLQVVTLGALGILITTSCQFLCKPPPGRLRVSSERQSSILRWRCVPLVLSVHKRAFFSFFFHFHMS